MLREGRDLAQFSIYCHKSCDQGLSQWEETLHMWRLLSLAQTSITWPKTVRGKQGLIMEIILMLTSCSNIFIPTLPSRVPVCRTSTTKVVLCDPWDMCCLTVQHYCLLSGFRSSHPFSCFFITMDNSDDISICLTSGAYDLFAGHKEYTGLNECQALMMVYAKEMELQCLPLEFTFFCANLSHVRGVVKAWIWYLKFWSFGKSINLLCNQIH